jgi:hypothetical protein
MDAATARADVPSLDGPWTMTAVSETFVVQQWGGSCGPAPVSDALTPPGPALVDRDGSEIAITLTASRRTFRSDQCLDPMPTLARDAHSNDGHTWRTRCTTPANDPRHAIVNTAFFLTDEGTISIAETGRYELTIKGSRCVADVRRDATARHAPPNIRAAPAAAPVASGPSIPSESPVAASSPPPPPESPCGSPGDPTRLEVRPSRKLLRFGESYRFRALVVDANGCPTGTPIQWSIGGAKTPGHELAPSPSVDGFGRLTIPAAGIAGDKFDVVASAAGQSARAAVEVTSPETYEALLARSGLDSNGEREEPSVTRLATTSLGASTARAEDDARRRRLVFIAIVCGLAVVLAAGGIVAALRARRRARSLEIAAHARHAERMRAYEREKRDREEQHAAQTRAHLESVARAQQATAEAAANAVAMQGPLFCPSCHREYAAGTAFCPFDSNRLVVVTGHESLVAGPVGGICPTCRRGFNPGVRICPTDGDELVPASVVGPRAVAVRGKICPTCGGRFDGSAAFCGKDGTQLVLIN